MKFLKKNYDNCIQPVNHQHLEHSYKLLTCQRLHVEDKSSKSCICVNMQQVFTACILDAYINTFGLLYLCIVLLYVIYILSYSWIILFSTYNFFYQKIIITVLYRCEFMEFRIHHSLLILFSSKYYDITHIIRTYSRPWFGND